MDIQILFEIISNIGLSGIFLFLLFFVYKDKKTSEDKKDSIITRKDSELSESRQDLVDIISNNTEAMVELKSVVKSNTKSIDATNKLVENINLIMTLKNE